MATKAAMNCSQLSASNPTFSFLEPLKKDPLEGCQWKITSKGTYLPTNAEAPRSLKDTS